MGKIGQEGGAAAGAIHFGECALNQRVWQLKGGKAGCYVRGLLLGDWREMSRAKDKKEVAPFERKRLSRKRGSEKEV